MINKVKDPQLKDLLHIKQTHKINLKNFLITLER